MSHIADVFMVSRASLYPISPIAKQKRQRRLTAQDNALIAQLKQFAHVKPSYGYRRLGKLLNNTRDAEGEPRINHKRILRLCQAGQLTLQRHTARQDARTHDGKVAVLHSNTRWCSDGFEFKCRNGDKITVAFVMDACDREVIAWEAAHLSGLNQTMVCDMMVKAVETRFGAYKTPHPVEWLSDNGSAYIAKETANIASALGLKLCFTPPRSPQSNGMSESFVKTIKRDYIALEIIHDAQNALKLLPKWFNDYNLNHPHSALKYRSPNQAFRDNIKKQKTNQTLTKTSS
jgi:putative transposase